MNGASPFRNAKEAYLIGHDKRDKGGISLSLMASDFIVTTGGMLSMSEMVTLDTHEAIRDWVAARNGNPAFVSTSIDPDAAPVLRIVFEPEFVADVERPLDAGGLEIVEWDDWFRLFDREKLVMLVAHSKPGKLDFYYQILPG
ncbi:hypothetical protein [Brucella intermedia]|uniref:hypothetical protein n=1 Tax=Brucella intermedia TaxID=94625 RepID=UPI001FFF0221|nr:hypothetical protein [Brucella intermedia]